MPIKLCQNCGLKVFVEEGQPIPVPFLCARCQAAMRAAQHQHERAPTLTMTNRPRPLTVNVPGPGASAPAPAAPLGDPGKSQLKCPACSATFSVRLPEQPARGKCPKCFQSLLVYPDGTVVIAKSSASGIMPPVGGSPSSSRVGPPVADGRSPSRVGQAVAASPSASRVGQPVSDAGSPSRVGQAVADGGSPSRVGQPVADAPLSDSRAGQVAGSITRIGRPTSSRPAMPEPAPAADSSSEPITMEGPSDASEGAAGAQPDGASTQTGQAPAVADKPAAAAGGVATGERAAKVGRDAKGARKPGTLRHADAALLKGDSSAKFYAAIIAVALPVLVGFALYLLRANPAVTGLLEKVGTPYKTGFVEITGRTLVPAPGAREEKAGKKPETQPAGEAQDEKKPATAPTPSSEGQADKQAAPSAGDGAPKAETPAEPKAEAPKPETPAEPSQEIPKPGEAAPSTPQ